MHAAVRNLGGHDLAALGRGVRQIDDTRPTVIFAYTVKGYGLAMEGHPQNHSALLIGRAARRARRPGLGVDLRAALAAVSRTAPRKANSVPRPPPGCTVTSRARHRRLDVPADLGRTPTGVASTQAALGRALLDLSRAAPETARRIVTVSPDVASSTNLGGWVNKVGVWSHERAV